MGRQQILMLIACLLLTTSLTSCGRASEQSQSASTSSEIGGTEKDCKNEEAIAADLSETEAFFISFDPYCCSAEDGAYFGSAYSLEQVEITRRKTSIEHATDEVFITAALSSEYATYTGEFHLLYEFYDVGGWYLEQVALESGAFSPLAQVEDKQVRSEVSGLFYRYLIDESHVFIANHAQESVASDVVTVTLTYSDNFIATNGDMRLYFSFDGMYWQLDDYVDMLSYEFLATGTYLVDFSAISSDGGYAFGYPEFMYLEDGGDGATIASYVATSWVGGVDPWQDGIPQMDWKNRLIYNENYRTIHIGQNILCGEFNLEPKLPLIKLSDEFLSPEEVAIAYKSLS